MLKLLKNLTGEVWKYTIEEDHLAECAPAIFATILNYTLRTRKPITIQNKTQDLSTTRDLFCFPNKSIVPAKIILLAVPDFRGAYSPNVTLTSCLSIKGTIGASSMLLRMMIVPF